MESNLGHPPGSGGVQFLGGESLFQKFYPKIVADVRLVLGSRSREKGPDFEFSGTSGCGKVLSRILGDPAVIW